MWNNRRVMVLLALVATLLARTVGAAEREFMTAGYEKVLKRFVTADAEVRYAALKADSAQLDGFLADLAAADPAKLARWPEAERIAFWLNAYNAITLKTIIDNYPIRASGLAALRYPASSIRQIPGAWSRRRWTVLRRTMSLEDIEHKTLRAQFAEPRVHLALVCAARGCPPLRREPYRGDQLEEQLDDQARRYLASPAGLQLFANQRRVAISSIFRWFSADFGGPAGVRAFLVRYAPPAARAALADETTKVTFLDYDWRLNDADGA